MDDIRGDDVSSQQDTGNHPAPGAADEGGADRVGGTRSGAENVEHGTVTTIEKGPDVSRVVGLDEIAGKQAVPHGPVERAPERDERGRL